jgi:hypothetical protein
VKESIKFLSLIMALLFSSALVEKLKLVDGKNDVVVAVENGKVASIWKGKKLEDGFFQFMHNGEHYECDVDAVSAKSVKIGAVVMKDC